ncbi:MAG: AI-2E family transporter [Lactobacillaceae bacterium]|jgi:predicted PurR-regulated permease PerM|nr:AI-2E family transporter [Lactobacillaceae bacterium]
MEFLRKNRILYWTTEAVLVALLILLLANLDFIFKPIGIFLQVIFLPIVVAGFFFFLLKPVVNFLEDKWNVKHTLAVVIVFIGFLAIVAGAITFLIPQLVSQISNMISQIPATARDLEGFVRDLLNSKWVQRLNLNYSAAQFQKEFTSTISGSLTGILANVTNALSVVTSVAVNLITIPVVTFYFLLDGDKFVPFINRVFFPSFKDEVNQLTSKMNHVISRYIGGQFIEAVFVGTMVTISYTFIHQPFALLLGIFAGLANFVTYIGPIIGLIPALIVAITVSPRQVVAVVVIVTIISQIDGNLLYPNIIGKNLRIHPLTILVLLLTMGSIFGIAGVILAVPVYAVLRTVVLFLFDLYKLHKKDQEQKAASKKTTTPKTNTANKKKK